ncbi:MAG: T9SS type A sorting domain-containing protein [Bacteroidales bacterium]|nr:T9SS type A sorting domain-containing protein [Bacteroidales bacterium]
MKRNLPTLALACLLTFTSVYGQLDDHYPAQAQTTGYIVAEASANEEGTEAVISWDHYNCVQHITYEDGSMENMFIWGAAGGRNAVRFTPYFYPATLVSGKVFIGEGHFPQNFEVIGSKFAVEVFDDDGPDGMPGTLLDSKEITVKNYYWVSFGKLQAPIQEGDFYIAIHQLNDAPESIAIGIDDELPVEYRSYSKPPDGDWEISIFHDFMIRAVVSGDYNEQGKHTHLDEITYNVAEYTGFDPLAQNDTGTQTMLFTNLTNQMASVQGLTPGYRKYGVQAVYDDTATSSFFLTEILSTGENAAVVFEVSTNDGSPAEDALLQLKYLDYPFKRYKFVAPASGIINDTLWKGAYHIRASLEGYEKFEIDSVFIEEGDTIYIEFQKIVHPVCNLQIDTVTSLLSWNIHCDPPNPNIEDITGYRIYLDGELVNLCNDTSYRFPYLIYGTQYTAAVVVDYGYGLSDPVSVSFTSGYLPAPWDFRVELKEMYHYLLWKPPYVQSGRLNLNPDPLMAWGFNIDSMMFFKMNTEDYNITNSRYFDYDVSCGDFTRNINKGMFFINYLNEANYLLTYKPDADTIIFYGLLSKYHGRYKGMACDKRENKTYVGHIVDSIVNLAFIEPLDKTVYYIGEIVGTHKITALAFLQQQDLLVGVDPDEDKVYFIEKNTANATLLGDLGFDAHEDQSASWNPVDQQIYLAAYDNVTQQPGLYIIDKVTGNASLLAPLEGETTLFAFQGGSNYTIPPGLINFQIYESGELIDSVEASDTAYYYEPYVPRYYKYGVSAKYDLGFYGFPGKTGESEIILSDSVKHICYQITPFKEDWEFGSFHPNEWITECEANWLIDHENGNPKPSAYFSGSNPRYNYSCKLTSLFICGSHIYDGGIYLTYDLKLNDISASETEYFRIWIDNIDTVIFLKGYSNQGSFDWIKDSLDITSFTKGKDFNVVFGAAGANSSNVQSWYLDNIHVYQYCPPPEYISLTSPPDSNMIKLNWSVPPHSSKEIIGYYIYKSFNHADFVEIDSLWQDTVYIENEPENGNYCFYVRTLQDQCESFTDTVCVSHAFGISEQGHQTTVRIHPNPARDHLYVNTKVPVSRLDVFSAMGKKEMEIGELPAGNHRIELAGLRNGVYLISVETEVNQYVFKLLINK